MYEHTDIKRGSNIKAIKTARPLSTPHVLYLHPPKAQLTNQTQITTVWTRLNVTTCLYLSLNNSARSLSTLIAVDVKIDTEHKIYPEVPLTWLL